MYNTGSFKYLFNIYDAQIYRLRYSGIVDSLIFMTKQMKIWVSGYYNYSKKILLKNNNIIFDSMDR
jgi:hypothetical protein